MSEVKNSLSKEYLEELRNCIEALTSCIEKLDKIEKKCAKSEVEVDVKTFRKLRMLKQKFIIRSISGVKK